MEESVQRELLVHVDREAPPRLHRELGGPARGDGIGAARVLRELLLAIGVAGEPGRTLGDRDDVREPGRDEPEREVHRVRAGAAIRPLGGLGALATDAVGVAAPAELVGALAGGLGYPGGLELAALGGGGEQVRPRPRRELVAERAARAALGQLAQAPARGRGECARPAQVSRREGRQGTQLLGPGGGQLGREPALDRLEAERGEADLGQAAADRLEQRPRLGGDQDDVRVGRRLLEGREQRVLALLGRRVGAPLARLEAFIALSTLLRRLPGLRLAAVAIEWEPHTLFRKLRALPIVFDPQAVLAQAPQA